MTQWTKARSIRMLGALFGLSLMLSACDVSQLLTMLDESGPVQADAKPAAVEKAEEPASPATAKKAVKEPAAPAKPAAKKADKKPAAKKAKAPAAATGSVSKVEAEIFELLNATREQQGHKPLALDKGIAAGSRDYSCTMARTGQFKHADIGAAGVFGENIAAGYRSAASVHDGWMKSEGHRRNRMNDRFSTYGIGVCNSADGTS